MAKVLLSLRLDKDKKERLINIAQLNHINYTDLIRIKIDEIITESPEDVKEKIKKIIKEINSPFFFFKTQRGKKYAEAERERREIITKKIEELFNINQED